MPTPTRHDRSPWDVAPILKNASPASGPPEPTLRDHLARVDTCPSPSTDNSRAVNASAPGRTRSASPGPRQPFCWISAHGGAGATSLACGSGIGDALTGVWPDPRLRWPTQVAVVCRTNTAGLIAAGRLLHQAATGAVPDLTVLAVVAVADAPGRLPRKLRMRLAELEAAAPALFTVPWIEAWREHPYVAHHAAAVTADRLITLTAKEK